MQKRNNIITKIILFATVLLMPLLAKAHPGHPGPHPHPEDVDWGSIFYGIPLVLAISLIVYFSIAKFQKLK